MSGRQSGFGAADIWWHSITFADPAWRVLPEHNLARLEGAS